MESLFDYFDDYYVVGHGMGAMVAVHLSLIDPSKVRGLILLSPLRPDGYKSDIKIEDKAELYQYEHKKFLGTMID
jgi:pimeloyl-ACP methyl ester carboxylesterase